MFNSPVKRWAASCSASRNNEAAPFPNSSMSFPNKPSSPEEHRYSFIKTRTMSSAEERLRHTFERFTVSGNAGVHAGDRHYTEINDYPSQGML